METESSVLNPYKGSFGMQGWVCPKCGRVFSPYTSMCLYCKGESNILPNITCETQEGIYLANVYKTGKFAQRNNLQETDHEK